MKTGVYHMIEVRRENTTFIESAQMCQINVLGYRMVILLDETVVKLIHRRIDKKSWYFKKSIDLLCELHNQNKFNPAIIRILKLHADGAIQQTFSGS